MLTDIHNHTFASFDGEQTVFELCEAAIQNGVGVLGISEHFDCDSRGGLEHFPKHLKNWLTDIEKARAEYSGRLDIRQGVEIGQPHVLPEAAESILKAARFDTVIGSMHDLSGGRDIYFMEGVNADEFFEEYFTETLQMLKFGRFNILGHIDYPVRKLERSMGGDHSLKRWESLIIPCLREMVERCIALELNTVLLRCWPKCFGIEPWLLAEYKKQGGRMVTVGSDGHLPKYDNYGVLEAHKYLKENGFDKVTVFKDQKAQFIPINI